MIHERDCEFNIPQRRDEIVLVYMGNALVGYISCSLSNDIAKDAAIYILPEHRKKGIGKLILSKQIEDLRKKEIIQMFVEIRESNKASLFLFIGMGFLFLIEPRTGYHPDPVNKLVLKL